MEELKFGWDTKKHDANRPNPVSHIDIHCPACNGEFFLYLHKLVVLKEGNHAVLKAGPPVPKCVSCGQAYKPEVLIDAGTGGSNTPDGQAEETTK